MKTSKEIISSRVKEIISSTPEPCYCVESVPAPSVIYFDALQATNVAGGILPGSLRSTTWATVRDRAPDYQRLWRAKAAASDPIGGYSQRSDAGSRPSPHHLVPSPIDRSLLLVGRLRGGAPEDRDFGRRSRLTQSLIQRASLDVGQSVALGSP